MHHRSPRPAIWLRTAGWCLILLLLGGMLIQHPTAEQDLALARQAQSNLEWHRALYWYDQATADAPGSVEPLMGIAQIRLWESRTDLAHLAIAGAEQQAPHDPRVWYLAGEIASAQHLPAAATSAWQTAIACDPRQPSAQAATFDLMEQDLQAGQPARALDDAAPITMPTTAIMTDRAIAYLHTDNVALAQTMLAQITAPDSRARAYVPVASTAAAASRFAALGYADLSQGFPALALVPWHAALARDPRYGAGYGYLGWTYWQLGDLVQAQSALAQAQRIAATDPVTIGLQAVLLGAAHLPQPALQVIRRWQARHQPSATLWGIAATIAQGAQDSTAEGDARWQYALTATDDERVIALLGLADYFLRTGLGRDDSRASWAITAALASAPTDSRALDRAGLWASSRGDDTNALAFFQRAILSDPRNALAHAHFGLLEFRLNNRITARMELDKALELAGQDTVRAQIASTLAQLGAGADD